MSHVQVRVVVMLRVRTVVTTIVKFNVRAGVGTMVRLRVMFVV